MHSDPNYVDFKDMTPEEIKEFQEQRKIEEETSSYLKNVNPRKKSSAVPPPPKAGEIIYCQMCRQPMMPINFSKNAIERRWEFKWQVHWACKLAAEDYLDRATVGLLADRKKRGQ